MERAVINGSADGVYTDCWKTIPISCNAAANGTTSCIARRNGKKISVNERVTEAQYKAYVAGKTSTMAAATAMVLGRKGTFYSKGLNPEHVPPPGTGNIAFTGKKDNTPDELVPMVNKARGFEYLIIGGANEFSAPTHNETGVSQCSESVVAAFLMAVRPGAFLLCNGWDPLYSRPLGKPLGPATATVVVVGGGDTTTSKKATSKKVWRRAFASGTNATWSDGKGTVDWAPAAAGDVSVLDTKSSYVSSV